MTQDDNRIGEYPIDTVASSEVERLRLQHDAWSADANWLLDQIDIKPGWRCLDLGCGPRGLTEMLSERVGPDGSVVGLEYNPAFVEIARNGAAQNVEIIQGDAYATGLTEKSFDLVHCRSLVSTSGQPEKLVVEAKRLLRSGGVFSAQEPDLGSLNCYPPHPAWDRLRHAIEICFPGCAGRDPVPQQIYRLMLQVGFFEVQFRPAIVGTTSAHPWRDFLPSTSESMRSEYLERGLFEADEFDEIVREVRTHLASTTTIVTSVTMIQTWGRASH
ncbi:MAG: methyltransferase domain-containing protein [Acidiferrobacterales bacterium]|nr:methyltransferase domain-containing protein [Acidiferrobacterales bacterium]